MSDSDTSHETAKRAAFKATLIVVLFSIIAIRPVLAQGGFGPIEGALENFRGAVLNIASLVLLIYVVISVARIGMTGQVQGLKKLAVTVLSLIALQGYDKFVKDLIGTSPDEVSTVNMIAPLPDVLSAAMVSPADITTPLIDVAMIVV